MGSSAPTGSSNDTNENLLHMALLQRKTNAPTGCNNCCEVNTLCGVARQGRRDESTDLHETECGKSEPMFFNFNVLQNGAEYSEERNLLHVNTYFQFIIVHTRWKHDLSTKAQRCLSSILSNKRSFGRHDITSCTFPYDLHILRDNDDKHPQDRPSNKVESCT